MLAFMGGITGIAVVIFLIYSIFRAAEQFKKSDSAKSKKKW